MIHFFRRIRKRLISKEQIWKYLLYALGEIILVVLGILIALYINNSNDNRATEKEISSLFVKTSIELESNINQINSIITNHKLKDSAYYLTIKDKVSYDDFAKGGIPINWNTSTGVLFPLEQNAISQLLSYENVIPKKYLKVFERLKRLGNSNYKRVNKSLEQYAEFTQKLKENQLKYPWSGAYNSDQLDQKIEYYISSSENKSWSHLHHELAINNYARRLVEYRDLAIQIYYELGLLFDTIKTTQDFNYIQDWKWIEGEWISSNGQYSSFTFNFKYGSYMWDMLNAHFVELESDTKIYQGGYFLFKDFIFFSNNNIDQQYYIIDKIDSNSFVLKRNDDQVVAYKRILD